MDEKEEKEKYVIRMKYPNGEHAEIHLEGKHAEIPEKIRELAKLARELTEQAKKSLAS